MTKPKSMFIISPIGPRNSEIRVQFDKVRKHIIDPVATQKGYVTQRSDNIAQPGRITSQIIDHLKNDDLVVADLSRKNPNVYYELAIRHAVKKPVILIGESSLDIPFDLAAQRVIAYSLDPDDIINAREKLLSQINAVESDNFIVDSPITDAIEISSQDTSSEDKIQRILAILETQSIDDRELRLMEMRSRARAYPGFVHEASIAALMDWLPDRLKPALNVFIESKIERPELTTKQVARITGRKPNTTHIYLNELVGMGYLERITTEKPIRYRMSQYFIHTFV